ncbi:MAG: hypothetical protein ACOVO0_02515 [Burkholderiaceae bacterium]
MLPSYPSFSAPSDGPAAGAARFQLDAGQAFHPGGEPHTLWRVVSGVLRLDQTARRDTGDSTVLVMLALAGDLVGFEALCGSRCPFEVSALTDVQLQPLHPADDRQRQQWLVEALLQQPQRSHDMARLRTGPVASRLSELLCLLGHVPTPDVARHLPTLNVDALRQSLPPLRDLAEVVDAKHETVCRALAQLLPPRSRKSGPRRWTETAGSVAAAAMQRITAPSPKRALT